MPATTDDMELPYAHDLDIRELWDDFKRSHNRYHILAGCFRDHLRTLVCNPDTIDGLSFCENCDNPGWEMVPARRTGSICSACWDEWSSCDCCENRYPENELRNTLGDSDICDSCRENHYSYCEDCDGYYHDEDADQHDHDSGDDCCDSPQWVFTIRNDGNEPLANDTRVTITLPAGVIATEGLEEIAVYLRRYHHSTETKFYELSHALDALGDQWQTKEGNYTKRLSRLAYEQYKIKTPPEVLSQVGCIARDHSTQVNVAIEITRELNMSAEDFYHEDSCWWGGYSSSRCALKTNGGFAIRSFDHGITGRAWVMPLKRDSWGYLAPTFDTMTPAAFVVFNGYGDLSGYGAARIMAHMSGWTYRKIGFMCSPMYVNAGGYLVAPEQIAKQYTSRSLALEVHPHANLFGNEKAKEIPDV